MLLDFLQTPPLTTHVSRRPTQRSQLTFSGNLAESTDRYPEQKQSGKQNPWK
jgi:hypothetical protein